MNLLNRGNDLQEFFWPIIFFAKQQILENGTLPLWNNLFFSGTPLLPDPQSPLFYLPNVIFLLLPIGAAFIVTFLLHITLGSLGAYLAARLGFGFSKAASLFTAALYVVTPQIAGRLEAGHYGLVLTFAWLPFVVLAAVKLAKEPNFRWSVLLAISLAGLFFTHVLIFSITVLGVTAFWLATVISKLVTRKLVIAHFRKSAITFFILGALITFGLIAVTFLPQLEWQKETTRFLLLEAPDVYPKWTSAREFLTAILWPWGVVQTLDTEKWLSLGVVPTILALFGFWHLKRRTKILLAVLVGVVAVLALNNASPFYSLLLGQDWYVLMRVATRPWFIVVIAATFLAGFGFDRLSVIATLSLPKGKQSLAILIAILAVGELLFLSWSRLSIPVVQGVTPLRKGVTREVATKEVYEFLEKDEDRFRVFCTTRCLFQKDAVEYGLELVEGYGTLAQMNYFKHSWQLTGAYWNHYTLSIPPTGTYKFEKPQPDARSLGEYNTKYVVSPYELTDENFELQDKLGEYFIYKNDAFLSRAYFPDGSEAPIVKYSPNHIRVDTTGNHPNLILAEVYSPGWKAYLDGGKEVEVQETPNALRLVDIKQNTQFVDFKYQPKSYNIGRAITGLTILLLLAIYLKNKFYTST